MLTKNILIVSQKALWHQGNQRRMTKRAFWPPNSKCNLQWMIFTGLQKKKSKLCSDEFSQEGSTYQKHHSYTHSYHVKYQMNLYIQHDNFACFNFQSMNIAVQIYKLICILQKVRLRASPLAIFVQTLFFNRNTTLFPLFSCPYQLVRALFEQ